jgi:hypothetical protein
MHPISALHSYTHPTSWLRFWGVGHLGSQNDVIMSWLRLTATSNCFPHPYCTYTKWLSTFICYPWAYSISLTQLYLPTWVRLWGSGSLVESKWCDYVMVEADGHLKLLPISIFDIQNIWAHWYAVHWHTVAALHSVTHPTWLRLWGMWSLVELKWCIFVMVDADGHLKLLPTSILDTYKVIEHIDMLSMGIQYQPYTVIPTLLGSDFGVWGHLWSQNDEIMSWLRLTATSNCFPHPH